MINLFTSYYLDSNPVRQKELDRCLLKNIECEAISHIYLLIEYPIDLELLKHSKVTPLLIKSRPSYQAFFEVINSISTPGAWNIIANTDIYFDDTILNLEYYKAKEQLAVCLTRWDVQKQGVKFFNRSDSQDVWALYGSIKPGIRSEFNLGTPGCDNAIAASLSEAGYRIVNPSLSIRTYHIHLSGVRNYTPKDKVQASYKTIPITNDLWLR